MELSQTHNSTKVWNEINQDVSEFLLKTGKPAEEWRHLKRGGGQQEEEGGGWAVDLRFEQMWEYPALLLALHTVINIDQNLSNCFHFSGIFTFSHCTIGLCSMQLAYWNSSQMYWLATWCKAGHHCEHYLLWTLHRWELHGCAGVPQQVLMVRGTLCGQTCNCDRTGWSFGIIGSTLDNPRTMTWERALLWINTSLDIYQPSTIITTCTIAHGGGEFARSRQFNSMLLHIERQWSNVARMLFSTVTIRNHSMGLAGTSVTPRTT